jgi:hypothetical protein
MALDHPGSTLSYQTRKIVPPTQTRRSTPYRIFILEPLHVRFSKCPAVLIPVDTYPAVLTGKKHLPVPHRIRSNVAAVSLEGNLASRRPNKPMSPRMGSAAPNCPARIAEVRCFVETARPRSAALFSACFYRRPRRFILGES